MIKGNFTPKAGDSLRTYYGFYITMPFDLTDVAISMQVKKAVAGSKITEYSLENGGLELITSTKFKMKQQILNLEAGVYVIDMLFTFPNQKAVSYLKCEKWVINETFAV